MLAYGHDIIVHNAAGEIPADLLCGSRVRRRPGTNRIVVPQASDQFDDRAPGLQWQWQANPDPRWASTTARRGWLRLASVAAPREGNLWRAPNLLLQKFPAPAFAATATVEFSPAHAGEEAGLIVFGADYAWVGLQKSDAGTRLVVKEARAAADGKPETEVANVAIGPPVVHLRATVRERAEYAFSYSFDGRAFTPVGGSLTARPGRWVGAKIGLFAVAPPHATRPGHADFNRFVVAAGDVR